jgi:Leucine-rich repeat (LRR) protein
MLDELPILEELVLLNLTNNQIEDIDVNALIDLDELKTLILSHNRIRWIEDDVFEWGPDELRHIYLDHNRLETIEEIVKKHDIEAR